MHSRKRGLYRAVVALAALAFPLAAEVYDVREGFAVEGIERGSPSYHSTLCGCRAMCSVQANCSAVVAKEQNVLQDGVRADAFFACYFTTTPVVYDSQLVAVGKSIVTFIKRYRCGAPFEAFPGLGCISVSRIVTTQGVALTLCPFGSQLLTPGRDFGDIRKAFEQFIFQGAEETDYESANYWLGFTYNIASNKWEWLDGTPHSSEVGQDLWGPFDPNNEGSILARLTANSRTNYGIMDVPGDPEYRYICELEHYY